MRILYVGGARDMQQPGGIETYGRELMKAMADRGHTIECLDTAPETMRADRRLRDYWPAKPFRQRYYFRRRFAHEDYAYHMALRRHASTRIASFEPDIVHALHSYPFGAIVDSRLPTVVTAHGLEIEAIPPVVGSLRTARIIHANSRFTASLVRDRISGIRDVKVLTWGIRTTVRKTRDKCAFDLITVSRLVSRKNVDTVLRAIRRIGDLRYAIVGDGPEMSTLRNLTEQLGLTNVSLFGVVSDVEREQLLAQSRIFVMCPRHHEGDVEGLGLVYFEAFEQGLPVVASNKGGVPDAVGDAGIMVEDPEDVDEVAGAIRLALSEDTLRGLRSRVSERQHSHSWTGFVAKFESMYSELLEL